MSGWQKLSSRVVYDSPWTLIEEDKVINPVGTEVVYAILSAKDASAYVVPMDDDGNTYIVKQFRYPLQRDSWECVAGGVDADAIVAGAKRELLEETGLAADRLIHIGSCNPATGRSTIECQIFIATGIRQVSQDLDVVDGIEEAKKLPLDDVIAMIMKGEITCSQSIAAFMMAREYMAKEALS